jgi:hypothetical protein
MATVLLEYRPQPLNLPRRLIAYQRMIELIPQKIVT